MAQPSISLPDEFLKEADERLHGHVNRSEYFREALLVRFMLEDTDDWEAALNHAVSQYEFGSRAALQVND